MSDHDAAFDDIFGDAPYSITYVIEHDMPCSRIGVAIDVDDGQKRRRMAVLAPHDSDIRDAFIKLRYWYDEEFPKAPG